MSLASSLYGAHLINSLNEILCTFKRVVQRNYLRISYWQICNVFQMLFGKLSIKSLDLGTHCLLSTHFIF